MKKNFRKVFNEYRIYKVPFLLKHQFNFYNKLVGKDYNYIYKNKNSKLQETFNSFFPIFSKDNLNKIKFVSYKISQPLYTIDECKFFNKTYCGNLILNLELYSKINFINKKINKNKYNKDFKLIQKKEINFGIIPLITENATFIINGIEKVIVSQLHKSFGINFSIENINNDDKNNIYLAQIIPFNGCWLNFEIDNKNIIYFKINQNKKLLVTTLLKAFGMDIKNILSNFYSIKTIFLNNINDNDIDYSLDILYNRKFNFNFLDINNHIIIKSNINIDNKKLNLLKNTELNNITRKKIYIIDKYLSENIYNEKKEIIAFANQKIDENLIDKINKIQYLNSIKILIFNNNYECDFISKTLNLDKNITNQYLANKKIILNNKNLLKLNENQNKKKENNNKEEELKYNNENIDDNYNLIKDLFSNKDKYDLSIIGRLKLNEHFNENKTSTILDVYDIISVIKYLINIKRGLKKIDDFNSLLYRRVRGLDELVLNNLKKGLFFFKSQTLKNFSHIKSNNFNLNTILKPLLVTSSLFNFFNISQLCQFMDQTNPLSEITHKRRLSSLGPGGIKKNRISFNIRDIHLSHYGRICPIETPEGSNIGLINSLAIYSDIDKYGFITTPLCQFSNNNNNKNKIIFFTYFEELFLKVLKLNLIKNNDKYSPKISIDIKCNYFIDVSKDQILSIASSLIPFIEHNDVNRALMGANMLRQAVPCIYPQKPIVSTGIESILSLNNTKICLYSKNNGKIKYVDSSLIILEKNIKNNKKKIIKYFLNKNIKSNSNTVINFKPIVNIGDNIKKNDIIANSNTCDYNELALGQNVLVAYMPWYGYNFEDSVIISEKIVNDQRFTSIYIDEVEIFIKKIESNYTKITRDIPNISERELNNLDENGIIKIGSRVCSNDILVGRLFESYDKNNNINYEISEKEFLDKISGKKNIKKLKDLSLRVPKKINYCTVVDIKLVHNNNNFKNINNIIYNKLDYNINKNEHINFYKKSFFRLRKHIKNKLKNIILKNYIYDKKNNKKIKINENELNKISFSELFKFNIVNDNNVNILKKYNKYKLIYKNKMKEYKDHLKKVSNINYDNKYFLGNYDLIIKIKLMSYRFIQLGDKMSGRHGNKGVIAKIVPIEDMPYMKDGTSIDIILNPLSVPSRMNLGQLLETHLGFASLGIKKTLKIMKENNNSDIDFKEYIKMLYSDKNINNYIDNLSYNDLKILVNKIIKEGFMFLSQAFSGITEKEINRILNFVYNDNILDKYGIFSNKKQVFLYDGITGEKYDNPITVGYIYYLKLYHMVDDKIHARSIGPYSLITQQPLAGKSSNGGQRLGEMEVWALEAYGAAYILKEMMTIKSDDIKGRLENYYNIINNKILLKPNIPESFNVLIKEIQSLGLNIVSK